MTEIMTKKLNNFDEIKECNGTKEISVPTHCCPNGSSTLDALIFRDNGALIFDGNYDLKVEKVYNYKDEVSLCDYEFIIEGKNGENAANANENGSDALDTGNVSIDLGIVEGNIRIQAAPGHGGNGFDGISGGDGGDGGDGFRGGNGGNGGDAQAGTNGGNGGDAPNINIIYTLVKKSCGIYVNGNKTKKNLHMTISGGEGGKGGRAAEGGKGGKGGKGIDFQHNGVSGEDGASAAAGKDGADGADGMISIQRRTLNEILDNYRGTYIFDLSDKEEREYCINEMGGPELLKKYETLTRAINRTAQQKNEVQTDPIKINLIDKNCTYLSDGKSTKALDKNSDHGSTTKLGQLSLSYTIDLYDTKTPLSNEARAAKWKFVTVQANAVNTSYGTGYPVISQNYETTDSYGGVVEFCSEILEEENLKGNIVTKIKICASDGYGNIVCAEKNDEIKNGEVMTYVVENIEVKDPKWNRKSDDGIIMLYGRTDEQKIYSKADYSGGDYYKNAIKSGNKIATLMPFSGTVTFSKDYELLGPTPVEKGGMELIRPSLDYSSKAVSHGPDVLYQNNLEDKDLYDYMIKQECFKAHQTVINPYVDFDFSLNRGDNTSHLDWHDDIKGEMDNHDRIVYLRGNFSYRVRRKNFPEQNYNDVQISVTSITKEDLARINKGKELSKQRDYYKFLEGSNLIYIPPIHIYWGCLGRSVLIKTDKGELKTAETVKIGDKLLAYGGKTVTVDNIFTGKDKTIYRLKCDGFETLLSGAHPVLGENGKGIAVNKLKAGDKIMTEKGGMTKILSVKKEPYNDIVYNFTFEGEKGSVYIIADGIFAGDLNAQNEALEEPQESEEAKEKRLELIWEMHSLFQELRNVDAENKK